MIYRVWTRSCATLNSSEDVSSVCCVSCQPVTLQPAQQNMREWKLCPNQWHLQKLQSTVFFLCSWCTIVPSCLIPWQFWSSMVKVSPGISRCFRPRTFQDRKKAWILKFVHNHWDDIADFWGGKATKASVQDFICLLGKGPCSHLSAQLVSSGRAPFAVLARTTHFTLETLKL